MNRCVYCGTDSNSGATPPEWCLCAEDGVESRPEDEDVREACDLLGRALRTAELAEKMPAEKRRAVDYSGRTGEEFLADYALERADELKGWSVFLRRISSGGYWGKETDSIIVSVLFRARCSLERVLSQIGDGDLAERLTEIDQAIGLEAAGVIELLEREEYEEAMAGVTPPPGRWWTLGAAPVTGAGEVEAALKELGRRVRVRAKK
jgi:hypothetical protein